MSGLYLAADLSGAALPPGSLEGLFAADSRLRSDGRRGVEIGSVALGHRHLLTTPEERDERQPVSHGGLHLALDGRLDNRGDLLTALGEPSGARLSDAALAVRAIARWDLAAFDRFRGAFALICAEAGGGRVICARDQLGDRTLYYRQTADRVVAASTEAAVLASSDGGLDLDHDTLVRFLALEAPREGSTFHSDLRELPAGSLLIVEEGTVRFRRWWDPRDLAEGRAIAASDGEWAERFVAALESSVRAASRCIGRLGLMISGGLDSSPVAAIASEEPSPAGARSRPRAYAWVFGERSAADDSPWIAAVVERLGLDLRTVDADRYWPARRLGELDLVAGRPDANAFRELKQALYERAAADGCRVLLSGAAGDMLYVGSRRGWLAAALAARRWDLVRRQVWGYLVRGPRGGLWSGLAGLVSPHRSLRRSSRSRSAWLKEGAREHLDPEISARSRRLTALAGPRSAWSHASEQTFAGVAGIEVRDPYRDVGLAELALQVPDHLLFRGGRPKHLARISFRGVLPDSVLDRRVRSDLSGFFSQGILRERGKIERILRNGGVWRRWVREEFPGRALDSLERGELPSAEQAGLWACVALESWLQRAGLSGEASRS